MGLRSLTEDKKKIYRRSNDQLDSFQVRQYRKQIILLTVTETFKISECSEVSGGLWDIFFVFYVGT